MVLRYFKSIKSTQVFLCDEIRKGCEENSCVYSFDQSAGIGSRGNAWEGKRGNLYLSLALKIKDLPKDLHPQSISIYFASLMKELLEKKGSKLWLKWPNDFYLGDKKIGGLMSNKIKFMLVIGLGLNIIYSPKNKACLDIKPNLHELAFDFANLDFKNISWKDTFSKFMLDFQKARDFSFHYEGESILLKKSILNEDGSISFDNQRIYSTR